MTIDGRPYGRQNKRTEAIRVFTDYQGETYYGRPALKPTHYHWPIAIYFWAGGIAGAAQIIATAAEFVGRERDRNVVRTGRYVALAGSLASPVLLIVDLQTPQRWYNMLRIFRRSSAMSIGSWTLAMFGTVSGLAAAAQALDDLQELPGARTAARWLGLPAAGSGMMMTIYTGALIGTTSVPLWAAADDLLPALFGLSSTANAAAALSLLAEATDRARPTHRSLEGIALMASAAELALTALLHRRWRRLGVADVMQEQPYRDAYRWGAVGLGIVAPLVIDVAQRVTRQRSRSASVAAAIATLVGSLIQRSVFVFAGNESARRPSDYFRFTQPQAPRDGQDDVTQPQEAGAQS